jgi:glycosyltransferase involved in cell wall biosynthesis
MTHTAYFICPDDNRPYGGIRKIYRFVDVLNDAQRSAVVIHAKRGFRAGWFDNRTRILHAKDVRFAKGDLLVIPEIYRERIPQIAPGNPHLVLNQGAYITFADAKLTPVAWRPVVSPQDTIGMVTVSEDSRQYLQWCFAGLPVHRIRLGLDPSLFFPPPGAKRRAVAFMPGRNRPELLQLLRILDQRGVLDGWELTPIDKMSELEVAQILRSAAVFLALSRQEGFGLPSLEAMASGCVVVGHHGGGGREFLRPGISYPIEDGEVLQFARTVEEVLTSWSTDDAALRALGRRASDFVRQEYGQDQEVRDVLDVALDSVAGSEPGSRELRLEALSERGARRVLAPVVGKARQLLGPRGSD